MAKIVLIDLEHAVDRKICRALAMDSYQIEHQAQNVVLRELRDADMVFAGGEPASYMSLLRRVREALPTLPFVVITHVPETREWLDALEAGATDYCSASIGTRQLHWLIESALPLSRFTAG